MMTTPQFVKAGKELETLNLGTLVLLKPKGRPNYVFVKKTPMEARPILAANEDLCSLDYYDCRYNQSVSKSITLAVRHELVQMRVVSAKQLK